MPAARSVRVILTGIFWIVCDQRECWIGGLHIDLVVLARTGRWGAWTSRYPPDGGSTLTAGAGVMAGGGARLSSGPLIRCGWSWARGEVCRAAGVPFWMPALGAVPVGA